MLSKFSNWLDKNGASGSSLYFKEYTETMRGVYSNKSINSGTNVMKIPSNMIIHSNMVRKKSDIVKKLLNQQINFISPAHVHITIYMIETFDDPTHFFYPYYKILPENLDNIPLFWSEDDLNYLTGSYLIDLIRNKNNKLEKEYNKIVSHIPYFKNLANFNKYKYIRSLVASRNFTLKINDKTIQGMVPWADMLNHSLPAQTKWGYRDDFFYIDSIANIESNSEIMDSYGLKTNATYLLHYGFTVADDANREKDSVKITIKSQEVTLSIPFNNYILQNQLLNLFRKNKNNLLGIYRNLKTEKTALFKINKTLVSILDKYATTYKDDIKLLDSGDLDPFSDRYNALIIVSGEKKILQHCVDCIFKILEYIDLKPEERTLNKPYLIDYFNLLRSQEHSQTRTPITV